MKLKTACFVILPLIFFGCGAYFHITKPKETVDFQKFPENCTELQQQIDNFHGPKR